MPLYDFECPQCHKIEEHYVSTNTVETHRCFCQPNGESFLMKRIVGMPGLVRVGGTDGKLRQGDLLRKRNAEYSKSSHGRAEHLANVAAAHKRLGV